VPTQENLT
jgi:prevent-host-death family protein